MHKNSFSTSKNQILIVDDDITIRKTLCTYLQKNGLDPIEAADYDQAFELFKLTHPALVLTDVKLPGKSGIDLLYDLKKLDPEPMVIIMSAYGNEEILLKALRGGATNYFTKPFDYSELHAFLKSTLRHPVEQNLDSFATFALDHEKKLFVFATKDADISHIVSQIALNFRLVARESELTNLQLGIMEMLDNAIEHGHLRISYEEKRAAIENGTFGELLRSRMNEGDNAEKKIRVEFELSHSECTVTIEDEGDGFDWRALPDPSAESLHSPNGRGIFLTRIYYDAVTFNDKGNRVTLHKKALR